MSLKSVYRKSVYRNAHAELLEAVDHAENLRALIRVNEDRVSRTRQVFEVAREALLADILIDHNPEDEGGHS